jgi:hypothetical protein
MGCLHFKISPSDGAIPENCISLGRSASWMSMYLGVGKDKFSFMTGGGEGEEGGDKIDL